MRISDWSSDVCSSDLQSPARSSFSPSFSSATRKVFLSAPFSCTPNNFRDASLAGWEDVDSLCVGRSPPVAEEAVLLPATGRSTQHRQTPINFADFILFPLASASPPHDAPSLHLSRTSERRRVGK